MRGKLYELPTLHLRKEKQVTLDRSGRQSQFGLTGGKEKNSYTYFEMKLSHPDH